MFQNHGTRKKNHECNHGICKNHISLPHWFSELTLVQIQFKGFSEPINIQYRQWTATARNRKQGLSKGGGRLVIPTPRYWLTAHISGPIRTRLGSLNSAQQSNKLQQFHSYFCGPISDQVSKSAIGISGFRLFCYHNLFAHLPILLANKIR